MCFLCVCVFGFLEVVFLFFVGFLELYFVFFCFPRVVFCFFLFSQDVSSARVRSSATDIADP